MLALKSWPTTRRHNLLLGRCTRMTRHLEKSGYTGCKKIQVHRKNRLCPGTLVGKMKEQQSSLPLLTAPTSATCQQTRAISLQRHTGYPYIPGPTTYLISLFATCFPSLQLNHLGLSFSSLETSCLHFTMFHLEANPLLSSGYLLPIWHISGLMSQFRVASLIFLVSHNPRWSPSADSDMPVNYAVYHQSLALRLACSKCLVNVCGACVTVFLLTHKRIYSLQI